MIVCCVVYDCVLCMIVCCVAYDCVLFMIVCCVVYDCVLSINSLKYIIVKTMESIVKTNN